MKNQTNIIIVNKKCACEGSNNPIRIPPINPPKNAPKNWQLENTPNVAPFISFFENIEILDGNVASK